MKDIFYKEEFIEDYPLDLVYAVIADVESYPNFIKWIDKVEVLNSIYNIKEIAVFVNFGFAKEKFITKDVFVLNEKIEIYLIEGPFKYLNSVWYFEKLSDMRTKINFEINFQFKSKLLHNMLSGVFLKAQEKIIYSFMQQVRKRYHNRISD